MRVELLIFERWYRYRYLGDPGPELVSRVVNAGILLPFAALTSMVTVMAYIVSVIVYVNDTYGLTLEHLNGMDPVGVVDLPLVVKVLFALGPPTLVLWDFLADRSNSRRIANAVGLAILGSTAVIAYEIWFPVLSVVAFLWIVDAISLAQGSGPI